MNRKVVISAAIVSMLVLGGILLSLRPSGNIEFVVVPKDAVLFLDGKKVSSKKQQLIAGEHELKALRDGFATGTKTFTATKDEQIVELALDTNSSVGVAYLKNHPKEAYLRESIRAKESDELADKSLKQNPVIELLPFIDREWRIDYGRSQKYPDDPTRVAIIITATSPQGKQDALDWLRFKGFNPDELEILYN